VPFGENAFVWHDPEALEGRGGDRRPNGDRPERAERQEGVEAPVAERAERPERAERSERSGRRGRGRGERGERVEAAEAPRVERVPAPRVDAADLELAPLAPAVIEGPPADIWVELPPQEEPPKKARRPRSRGRKATEDAAPNAEVIETLVEAVVETSVVAPVAEDTPLVAADVEVEAPAAIAPEAASAPAQEPIVTLVSTTPDPAEISTPPEKPKRGWWRRG
jgi:ribonuclease E